MTRFQRAFLKELINAPDADYVLAAQLAAAIAPNGF
jgi:hypothetical protein